MSTRRAVRRPWARPLVPLYRAAQAFENWLRARGFPKTKSLACPVVSVGSLSAGGAGKTPVVIALAEMLRDAGWRVDVLSRGYGRSGKGVERVEAGDAPVEVGAARVVATAAQRFGDEPWLIAQRAGVPVWVGADRFAVGRAVEALPPTLASIAPRRAGAEDGAPDPEAGAPGEKPIQRLHLLDDGFQHRQLTCALDVVLVTEQDMQDVLLPAGNLREPLRALARADAVVVREEELNAVAPKVWPLLREGAQMWAVRRTLRFVQPKRGMQKDEMAQPADATAATALSAGLRPLAFCAIARPEGFAASLAQAGCAVVDTVIFRDHAPYGERQLREIVTFAKQLQASGLVTTEKDAVKLSPATIARLEREVGPLVVAALDATFVDAEKVLRAIEARINKPVAEAAQ